MSSVSTKAFYTEEVKSNIWAIQDCFLNRTDPVKQENSSFTAVSPSDLFESKHNTSSCSKDKLDEALAKLAHHGEMSGKKYRRKRRSLNYVREKERSSRKRRSLPNNHKLQSFSQNNRLNDEILDYSRHHPNKSGEVNRRKRRSLNHARKMEQRSRKRRSLPNDLALQSSMQTYRLNDEILDYRLNHSDKSGKDYHQNRQSLNHTRKKDQNSRKIRSLPNDLALQSSLQECPLNDKILPYRVNHPDKMVHLEKNQRLSIKPPLHYSHEKCLTSSNTSTYTSIASQKMNDCGVSVSNSMIDDSTKVLLEQTSLLSSDTTRNPPNVSSASFSHHTVTNHNSVGLKHDSLVDNLVSSMLRSEKSRVHVRRLSDSMHSLVTSCSDDFSLSDH